MLVLWRFIFTILQLPSKRRWTGLDNFRGILGHISVYLFFGQAEVLSGLPDVYFILRGLTLWGNSETQIYENINPFISKSAYNQIQDKSHISFCKILKTISAQRSSSKCKN